LLSVHINVLSYWWYLRWLASINIQDHRSDRSSVRSWRPMVPTSRGDNQSESSHSPDRYRGSHHHQPTIHSRRRRTDIWGGGTEYVLLPCVIMCVPHNVPGGVCCTFDVLYCCWAPVFEVTVIHGVIG
jgi:hypothetical protein